MTRIIVKDDGRAEGRWSLYVEGAPNGPWYTGLTFGSLRRAQKVERLLNRELGASCVDCGKTLSDEDLASTSYDAVSDPLLDYATVLEFGDYPYTVRVEKREPGAWVVVGRGQVLNAAGAWEFEPQPSSRTDAFKNRTRFGRDEAVALAREAVRRG